MVLSCCDHGDVILDATADANLPLLAEAVRRFGGREVARSCTEAPGTLVFLAVERSEVVGWCWGYHLPRPDASSMLYLHELEVAEADRRLRIGQRLLQVFMESGRSLGANKMFLTTSEANRAARRLYESVGGTRAEQGPTVNFWFQLG